MTTNKYFGLVVALMLCVGALFFSTPAYAGGDGTETATEAENLTVNRVWLEDEMLHIEVTDNRTGDDQTLGVSLSGPAGNSEFISVQAVDKEGNKSNVIQIKNPFYNPQPVTEAPAPTVSSNPEGTAEPTVAEGSPFTPDGTGSVLDNGRETDGKEFFSIETGNGNIFYLIVDRQRSSENVYLLNAVTEQDLNALAEPGGVSAVPEVPANTPEPTPSPAPERTEEPPAEEPASGVNGGSVVFIIIAALAAGAAGYYFKIVRPGKAASDEEDFEEPEEDDSRIYDDYEDDLDGGDKE